MYIFTIDILRLGFGGEGRGQVFDFIVKDQFVQEIGITVRHVCVCVVAASSGSRPDPILCGFERLFVPEGKESVTGSAVHGIGQSA